MLLLLLKKHVNYIHTSNRRRKERLVMKEHLGHRRGDLSFNRMHWTLQFLLQHPFNLQIKRIISIYSSSLPLPSEMLLWSYILYIISGMWTPQSLSFKPFFKAFSSFSCQVVSLGTVSSFLGAKKDWISPWHPQKSLELVCNSFLHFGISNIGN